jgi:hypothetical protein
MARPIVHGKTKTSEFKTWQSMHQRCYNPKAQRFPIYGARGIKVEDERWFNFMDFLNDMGERPINTSLDRIDSDKGYCKENCRWADIFQQNSNRRNVVLIEYDGQLKPMRYWAEMFGTNVPVLRSRLKSGKSVEEALRTPIKTKYRK